MVDELPNIDMSIHENVRRADYRSNLFTYNPLNQKNEQRHVKENGRYAFLWNGYSL